MWNRRKAVSASAAAVFLLASPLRNGSAATDPPQEHLSAKQIVATVLANEDAASLQQHHYAFSSQERSDRTGGHLWSEHVVETKAGVVRLLLTEDGKPLDPVRRERERQRLAAIARDPADFAKKSQGHKDDLDYARRMEPLVGSAFDFSDVRNDDGYLHIDFMPNPGFKPQSFAQRVMHAVSGTMLVDAKTMRLHRLEGHLSQDVTWGFGILAKVRAGSRFAVTRDCPGIADWKMTSYDTDFEGRVLFFKSIALNAHAIHSGFVRVPDDISVSQAIAMLEK